MPISQHDSVLVTGAASGIGRSVVSRLLAEGQRVFAVDRDAVAMAALAKEAFADQLIARVLDVRNRDELDAALASNPFELRAVIHCAGIWRGGRTLASPDSNWEELWSVSVSGARNVLRSAVPYLENHPEASVVVVSSNAARVPRIGMAEYAATKAALTMFTKCLALELAEKGIRCNVVSPGSTNTPMQQQFRAELADAGSATMGSLKDFRVPIPLGRSAEAADIASVILFLISKDARHMTMADLCVDGGATLGA